MQNKFMSHPIRQNKSAPRVLAVSKQSQQDIADFLVKRGHQDLAEDFVAGRLTPSEAHNECNERILAGSNSYALHERLYEARRVMNNLIAEIYALDGVQKEAPAEDVLDLWASRIQKGLDASPSNVLPVVELHDAGQALWDINLAALELRRLRGLLDDQA